MWFGAVSSLTAAPEGRKREVAAYAKVLPLTLAYEPARQAFRAVLKNTSPDPLLLRLNPIGLEGTFTVVDAQSPEPSFYAKSYLRALKVPRETWKTVELQPKQVIEWDVRLDELVYRDPKELPVTAESLAGKSVTFQLDQLAVASPNGKPAMDVKIQSSAIVIPVLQPGR